MLSEFSNHLYKISVDSLGKETSGGSKQYLPGQGDFGFFLGDTLQSLEAAYVLGRVGAECLLGKDCRVLVVHWKA